MKPLMPLALVSVASFAFLAGQLAPTPDALACGDYGMLFTELTQTDVDLAVGLLEKQVPDRLTAIRTAPRARQLFSRAAPRPVPTGSSVVVVSYEAPRVGDRVLAEHKVVEGKLTIAAPSAARLKLPYRVVLADKAVQLWQADKWVAASEWTRTPRTPPDSRTGAQR